MSILIKGMDKPTDCGLCPFEDFGYCNVKGERNTSESGIDADCPLIEVADRKTEPQNLRKITQDLRKIESNSEKPNNCTDCEHWSDTEDGCADRHGCKDEPQIFICPIQNDYEALIEDEPQTETQTETQNSNLGFEKPQMERSE